MYKYLIIAVVFFIVGGAGYYFNSSGGSKLLVAAISEGKEGVSSSEVFSGVYECTTETGCNGITHLALNPDGAAEVLAVSEETVPLSKGTWGVAHGGSMVLLFEKAASSTYPTSITIKQVSIMKLSNFSTKKKLFPGMFNPTFKRVGNFEDASLPSSEIPLEN